MRIEGGSTNVPRVHANENGPERQGSRLAQHDRQNEAARNRQSTDNQDKVEKKLMDRVRGTAEESLTLDELQGALDQANKSFEPLNRHFEFTSHEKINRLMVKVVDSKTDEIIREIPPEKLVDMVANMLETAGILVDERG